MFARAHLQKHTHTYTHMYMTYTDAQHPPTHVHTHTPTVHQFCLVRAIFLGKFSFFSFNDLIRWDEILFLLKEEICFSIVAALTSPGRELTVE